MKYKTGNIPLLIRHIGLLICCAILLPALVSCSSGTGSNGKPMSPMEVLLTLEGTPSLNNVVQLNLSAKALSNAPNTTVEILLPEGVVLVSGEIAWQGDISENNTVNLSCSVKTIREGSFTIKGSAVSTQTNYIFGKEDKIYLEVTSIGGTFTHTAPPIIPGDNKLQPVPDQPGVTKPPPKSNGKATSPMEVLLTLDGTPSVNSVVQLNLSAKALTNAPNTSMQILLPEGVQLVSGEIAWQGDIPENNTVNLSCSVKAVREGSFTIVGSAISTQTNYVFGKEDKIYLEVTGTAGSFSHTAPQVKPGDNALQAVPVQVPPGGPGVAKPPPIK